MKKYLILILMLFIGITLKAQDLGKIKSQNTFFILFESSNSEEKIDLSRIINKNKDLRYHYRFYKNNKSKDKLDFSFSYSKYQTFDDAHNDINAAMVFRLNKSFLRKNKDVIITRDFMEKVGKNTIVDLFFRGNIYIFLIDKLEIENGKILLREVQFNYVAPE